MRPDCTRFPNVPIRACPQSAKEGPAGSGARAQHAGADEPVGGTL